MKAKVNQETCIGCGLCVDYCPEVFELTDDNGASIIVDRVPAESKEKCQEAKANCPVDAISYSE